jgi:hypothetical protein
MHDTKSNHGAARSAGAGVLQVHEMAKFQRKSHLIAPALFVQFGALSLIHGIESSFLNIDVFHIL